jgi:hypothetical protein
VFNLVSIFGGQLKSVAAGVAHSVIEQFLNDPAMAQKAGAAISAAISNIHVPTVLGTVIDQVVPHAAISWTPEQIKAAEVSAIVNEASTGDISASAMFAAGAAWAAGLAAKTLTDGAEGVIVKPAATGDSTRVIANDNGAYQSQSTNGIQQQEQFLIIGKNGLPAIQQQGQ